MPVTLYLHEARLGMGVLRMPKARPWGGGAGLPERAVLTVSAALVPVLVGSRHERHALVLEFADGSRLGFRMLHHVDGAIDGDLLLREGSGRLPFSN